MSRWDGGGVYYTKDCPGCPFYRALKDGEENIEVCGWGVAFKFLDRRERVRRCDLLRREKPRNPSHARIDGNKGYILKIWRKIKGRYGLQAKQLELLTK